MAWNPWRERGFTASLSWSALKDDYALYLISEKDFAKESVKGYAVHVGLFAKWCDRNHVSLVRATRHDIGLYYAYELSRCSRATTVTRVRCVRSFMRWLIHAGKRKGDPTKGMQLRRPKSPVRPPYTSDELRALIKHAMSYRDRLMIMLAIGTACRRQELLNVRVQDIDYARGEIRIFGKGNKERRVAPGLTVMVMLKRYIKLAEPESHIFLTIQGRRMTGQQAYLQLRKIADRANVVGAYWHRFRHTTAQGLLDAGMALDELQMVLGHSSIQMTAHYASYSAATRALKHQKEYSLADRIAG